MGIKRQDKILMTDSTLHIGKNGKNLIQSILQKIQERDEG
jgi:hypothetical protein